MIFYFVLFHRISWSLNQFFFIFVADNSQEDYTTWSLFLIYVGAALPDFAYRDTNFLPSLEGISCSHIIIVNYNIASKNNPHQKAVNTSTVL